MHALTSIPASENPQKTATVVPLHGRLDATSVPHVEKRLATATEGARQVVLDLAGLDYLSSAGLRLLLVTARRLQRAGGQLVLAAATPPVEHVFQMARLAEIIPVFAGLEQAIAFLAAPPLSPPGPVPLNCAEEICLLALDDETGALRLLPACSLDTALAGALLMELAMRGRVDTDLPTGLLTVVDITPTGDPLLDETLRELQAERMPQPVSHWLRWLSRNAGQLVGRVCQGLVRQGILREENRRLLWVFAVRRYPLIGQGEVREVRARLRELVLGRGVPNPRDVALLGLAEACRLLDCVLLPAEISEVQVRLASLAGLDVIGRAVTQAVREIECALGATLPTQIG